VVAVSAPRDIILEGAGNLLRKSGPEPLPPARQMS
jgi:hypothetical protein